MTRKSSVLVSLALAAMSVTSVAHGVTVFSDNFNTSTGSGFDTDGAIGNSTVWSLTRSGTDFGASISNGVLTITNDATTANNASGWGFVSTATSNFLSPFSSTLSSFDGAVDWSFNMQQIRSDPAGFGSGSYGVAFVLGSTSTNVNASGNGYAVVLGNGGSTDPVRLVKFTGGLSGTLTDIISAGAPLDDVGTNFMSLQVRYDATSNTWSMAGRDDSSDFADPTAGTLTSLGSGTDVEYTGTSLAYMGGYWQGSTGGSQYSQFDNITVAATPSEFAFFDVNSASAGSGVTGGVVYSLSAANFSTSSAGNTTSSTWVDGKRLIFSAGTDAAGVSYTASVDRAIAAKGILVQEGNVTITHTAGGTLTLTDPNVSVTSGTSLIVNEIVSGAVGLTKTGAGPLTLTENNDYTGATTISEGTVNVGVGGVTGRLGTGGITVASGAGLTFNRSDNITVANGITSAGTITKSGTNTLTLGGTNSNSGATILSGGSLNITGSLSGGSALQLNSATVTTSGTATSSSFGATTLFGANVISPASGNVSISSFTRTNSTYGTVNIIVNTAGGTITTSTTATNLLRGWLTVNGTDWANRNTSDQIVAYTGYTTGATSTSNLNVTGNLTGTASTINTLRLGAAGATYMPPNSLTITTGGILVPSSAGATAVTIDIAGSTKTIDSSTDIIFQQFNTTAPLVFNSKFAATPVGVTKAGGGAVYLTNTSSNTGQTRIYQGALRANNGPTSTGSALGSGAVTVFTGGTLGGDGRIAGAVTLNRGATITAGASVSATGSLTTGAQIWNAGGTYAAKFSDSAGTSGSTSGWDSLRMSSLDLSAVSSTKKFNLALSKTTSGTFTYEEFKRFKIADITTASTGVNLSGTGFTLPTAGSINISSLFNLTTSGMGLTAAQTFTVLLSFDGAGGYDLELATTPEPTTAILFGLGFVRLMSRRNRTTGPVAIDEAAAAV